MFPCVPLFHPLFSLWTGRQWVIGIIFCCVFRKHLTKKTNLFRQKYLIFFQLYRKSMHNGAVSGQRGFSLVPVYCSKIHYCARSNATVKSNVTEVPGKCKYWVNIMPYLLWNRITIIRKAENELFYKIVFSFLASIIPFDTLKVEKKKKKTCTSGKYNYVI